jgi:dephospho-CoA kinase
MRRIGLTGNIASGKSTVSAVWRRLGAQIIDADVLARDAVRPGSPALAQIAERFGRAVVTAEGLDRAALRALVFADPAERTALEAILHPTIARLREAAERQMEAGGARTVVHEIPLLFETGMAPQFETIVLVDAPEAERLRRIVESRGVPAGEAAAMIAAQMPSRAKRARATHVLDNTGTVAELEAAAEALWRRIAAETA